MQLVRKTIFILYIVIIGLNHNHLSAKGNSNRDTCDILLIGSSYFNFNNLADLVQNMADSSNIEICIQMHGLNGLYLSDHASSPATEAKIKERDWDYVILQGCGILMAYPEYFTDHPVYPALVTLREKILAHCESTRMVFCMPWAFEDGMTWYQNWTDTFEDMQIHIYNNTLQYSEEIGFEIAPVGWAWYAVLEEFDYPLHYLHMSDWNHPSLRGSYLMACVIYSSVFQESTVNIPYYAGIPAEEADYFQAVASDTVLNNLEIWNILPLTTNTQEIPIHHEFHLYQNRPNPYNPATTISYSLSKKMNVKIIILDSMGAIVTTMLDKEQKPGSYSIEFNASGLSCGIYHYQITAGGFRETKTMILK